MNKLNKITSIVSIVLIIILSFFIVKSCNQEKTISEKINLINSLNDTVKIWKDKNGLSHTKTEVIKNSSISDFLKQNLKDKETKELQSIVKENKNRLGKQGSVSKFNGIVEFETEIPTLRDTIYIPKDGLVIKKPIYNSSFDMDGWVVGSVKASEDSTKIKLKVKNDYTVIIGEEKTGFLGLGRKKPFVEVTNKNPYSETTSLKTYQVENYKIKRFGIGPNISYSLGANGQLYPTFGIGLQYNVIRF